MAKSTQLVTFTIIHTIVMLGYMMVRYFVRDGIKKVRQFIENGCEFKKGMN